MLAIPAIDLRDGQVVQAAAQGGEKIRLGDPREVARRWAAIGFARIHVMDLHSASARNANQQSVRDLLHDGAAPMQVGGCTRTTRDIEDLLDDGAAWVIVGSRAVEERDWLGEITEASPGRVILAAEVQDRRVVAHGWGRAFPSDVLQLLDELSHAGLPLGGILLAAAHRDGQPQGTDLPLIEDAVEASDWPVFASGTIATMGELRALEDRGVAGAIVGAALYSGALDPHVVAAEFSS
jgi:phosphoribosylformimino-5-aminoimidazole carboxamide ribotide isomerase